MYKKRIIGRIIIMAASTVLIGALVSKINETQTRQKWIHETEIFLTERAEETADEKESEYNASETAETETEPDTKSESNAYSVTLSDGEKIILPKSELKTPPEEFPGVH